MAAEEAVALGGRATRRETIHLTLAFIGEVPEASLPLLIERARAVDGRGASLCLDRLGYWSHNHLRWAGAQRPPAALGELVAALRGSLVQADFAVDRGESGFFPHLTLVRKLRQAAADCAIEPPLTWDYDEFVLVRSELHPEGPAYRVLARFPLAPASGSSV